MPAIANPDPLQPPVYPTAVFKSALGALSRFLHIPAEGKENRAQAFLLRPFLAPTFATGSGAGLVCKVYMLLRCVSAYYCDAMSWGVWKPYDARAEPEDQDARMSHHVGDSSPDRLLVRRQQESVRSSASFVGRRMA
jgi:hypothetical protein